MCQLVGVDDRADAGDLTAGDIECAHADQPLLSVEKERSRAAVDLHGTQRHAQDAGGQAEPVDQRAREVVAPAQRLRERRSLAAAVACQLHVVGEQRLEPSEIALLGGQAWSRYASHTSWRGLLASASSNLSSILFPSFHAPLPLSG